MGGPRAFPLLVLVATAALVALAGSPATARYAGGCSPPERAPPLSTVAVRRLLAVNLSRPGFPTVSPACGGALPRTSHTLHCVGGYPLGGIVLEPPRRPTRSVLLLHGLSSEPLIYLTVVSLFLGDAPPADWASTRFLLPLAPVYARLFDAPAPGQQLPWKAVHAWFDVSHVFPYISSGALNGSTAAEVGAAFLATGVVEDRLGLAASTTRLTALASVQARGRLGRRLPAVPASKTAVVGHSLGGFMAWHLAVQSGVPWAGVVALSAHLPLTPYYARYPAVGRLTCRRCDGRRRFLSVAASNDELIEPLLSDAAAKTGRELLGEAGIVEHVVLAGSDHTSYLVGDANSPKLRQLLLGILDGKLPSDS